MSREYRVVWAGRHRRSEWDALCEDYRKRVERSIPVRDQWIKVRTGSDDPRRIELEGEALLAACPDPSWKVALDSGGRSLSSEKLSALLSRRRDEWPHPTVFLIGSDLGLDRRVTDSADLVLSLGPMTLGHELARLVLYEQLYRAVSIRAGISYHRDRF